MRSRLARWWVAFANAVGGFIEEAAFRVVLAFKVLAEVRTTREAGGAA